MKKFMLTIKENKKVRRITVSAVSVFLAVVLIAASVTVVNYRKNKVDVDVGSAVTETPTESETETVTDSVPETTAPDEIEESTTAVLSEESTAETPTETTTKKATSTSKTEATTKKTTSSTDSSSGFSSSSSNKTTTTTNPWSDIHFLTYDEVKWAVDEAIKYAKGLGCYIDTTMTTDGQYIDGKWSTSVGYRAGTDTATAITWGNCRTKEGFLESIKWDIDDLIKMEKKADEDNRRQAELEPDVFTYVPPKYPAVFNVYLSYGDALARHGLDTKNADGSTRYVVYIVY